MSHNTLAVDVSLNAVPIWTNYDATLCVDVIAVGTTCNSNGYLNTTSSATQSIGTLTFSLPTGLNITAGKTVAVYETVLDNFQDNNSIDSVFLNPRVTDAGPVNWGLLSVRSFSQGSGSYRVEFTFLAEGSGTVPSNNRYIAIGTNYNNAELAFLKPGERISGGMASYYYLEGSGTDAIVNAINNNNSSAVIREQGQAIVDAIEEAQENEEQALEDAQAGAESSGSSASTESQQATSSLLSVITGFFTAVMSADATSCTFDSHLPFMTGAGTIDLCMFPAPTLVQVGASLILVGLFVPFCIHMYNRFISITESFQR